MVHDLTRKILMAQQQNVGVITLNGIDEYIDVSTHSTPYSVGTSLPLIAETPTERLGFCVRNVL